MNLTFMKAKAEQRFGSVEKFSDVIGVSKVAVYKWLSTSRIPEDRVSQVVEVLKLDETEIDQLFNVPQVKLFFRKVGQTAPDKEVEDKFRALANTFFKLDANNYAVEKNFIRVIPESVLSVANHLRTILSLNQNEPASFSRTIVELKRYNVHVFFFPFQKSGQQVTVKATREVAFTAQKENRIIIFLDTGRTFDEALFDLCHELTHLVCNHESGRHNKEEEKFCNAVASELIYPKRFLETFLPKSPLLDNSTGIHKAAEAFQMLLSEFEWSPMGLALAFERDGKIAPRSDESRQLMKLQSVYKQGEKTVDELFFESLDVQCFDSLSSFFNKDIQKDREIYKPIIELKKAATFDRVSSRRFGEIFGIDSGDADELVNSWRIQEEELEEAPVADSEYT